jgi:hypothetical protein
MRHQAHLGPGDRQHLRHQLSQIALNAITERLNATEFPDQGFASLARQIIYEANERKRYVAQTYRALLKSRPEFREQLDAAEL